MRASVILLLALGGCASQPSCQPLRQSMPHSTIEQGVVADQIHAIPRPSQDWLVEYVLLRKSGALICTKP